MRIHRNLALSQLGTVHETYTDTSWFVVHDAKKTNFLGMASQTCSCRIDCFGQRTWMKRVKIVRFTVAEIASSVGSQGSSEVGSTCPRHLMKHMLKFQRKRHLFAGCAFCKVFVALKTSDQWSARAPLFLNLQGNCFFSKKNTQKSERCTSARLPHSTENRDDLGLNQCARVCWWSPSRVHTKRGRTLRKRCFWWKSEKKICVWLQFAPLKLSL